MNNFLRSKEPILCIRKSRIVAGEAKLLVRAIKKSVIGQVGDSIDKKCHLSFESGHGTDEKGSYGLM